MSILILADHDNGQLAAATLNTVTAAKEIGGEIHMLVAGDASGDVASAAAAIDGVAKVLTAADASMAHGIAENVAPLIQSIASGYTHLMAPATTTGKNIMPRVAALLDVMQVSDIIKVESADTFQRPIYAGNAIATVTSGEAIKVVTVRGTAFEAAAAEGGSAAIEAVDARKRQRPVELCEVGAVQLRASGTDQRADRHLGWPRHAGRFELRHAGKGSGQARRRRRCLARRC